MYHIDEIRLSTHPDARLRAAAADAKQIRAEFWRSLFRQAATRIRNAAGLPRKQANGRSDRTQNCAGSSRTETRLLACASRQEA
ncbi:hypothetical protein ACROSR_07925 [Roseovarius tibetensis]|uniref:hypothetical protein n=1 Tax=Roseovarius tibetensis TaxID=2685897 RepID=UPI003D7FF562